MKREEINIRDPFEIYHRPEDSRFDCSYWAPKCYEYQGKYYLITTLGVMGESKAVYALITDSPKGPFVMHREGSLTPEGWKCIDGTLFFAEKGQIYLIFSHSFEDVVDGEMCVVELEEDLKKSKGEPVTLFHASEAAWSRAIPFAKAERTLLYVALPG